MLSANYTEYTAVITMNVYNNNSLLLN